MSPSPGAVLSSLIAQTHRAADGFGSGDSTYRTTLLTPGAVIVILIAIEVLVLGVGIGCVRRRQADPARPRWRRCPLTMQADYSAPGTSP